MWHRKSRIARVQARAVKRATTDGHSPEEIERVKRSGDAAVAFAWRILKASTSKNRR